MAAGTVRITGLKETVSAFNKLERGITRELQKSLKEAAEPVAASARDKISRYRGASLNTIKPRASGSSVYVRQNARKVDGQHGNFGALQMRVGFEPALQENEGRVIREVEHALDRFTDSAGF